MSTSGVAGSRVPNRVERKVLPSGGSLCYLPSTPSVSSVCFRLSLRMGLFLAHGRRALSSPRKDAHMSTHCQLTLQKERPVALLAVWTDSPRKGSD